MEDYTGVRYGTVAWGDYDNDKDLDFLLFGEGASGLVVELYANNAQSSNQAPPAPVQPSSSPYSLEDETVTLNWLKPQDVKRKTPQSALTYNVMVGTQSGGYDVISPLATSTGARLLPATGNAERNNEYIVRTNNLAEGTYYWQVQAIDNLFAASTFVGETFTIDRTPTPKFLAQDDRAEKAPALPERFMLSLTYPNPFNLGTRLNLELPEDGHVQAIIYDLQGKEVFRLREEEMRAGYKILHWDGRNVSGEVLSSAAYLVKAVFEGRSGKREEAARRLMLVK